MGLLRLLLLPFTLTLWAALLPALVPYALFLMVDRDLHSGLSWFVKITRWFLTGKSNF